MTLKSRIGDLESDDTSDDEAAAAVSGAVEDLEALVGVDDEAGDLVTRTAALEADLNVGHLHVTTVVEALDVTGGAGRILNLNAFRDPADPDDTISVTTAVGALAAVAVRPNYTG